MATNLELDDQLILEAKRLGNFATKREAVTAALEEFVQRRKQLAILDLFGKVEFDPDYDYKKNRLKR
jgi:Arc/MetJ family transcription regulator